LPWFWECSPLWACSPAKSWVLWELNS